MSIESPCEFDLPDVLAIKVAQLVDTDCFTQDRDSPVQNKENRRSLNRCDEGGHVNAYLKSKDSKASGDQEPDKSWSIESTLKSNVERLDHCHSISPKPDSNTGILERRLNNLIQNTYISAGDSVKTADSIAAGPRTYMAAQDYGSSRKTSGKQGKMIDLKKTLSEIMEETSDYDMARTSRRRLGLTATKQVRNSSNQDALDLVNNMEWDEQAASFKQSSSILQSENLKDRIHVGLQQVKIESGLEGFITEYQTQIASLFVNLDKNIRLLKPQTRKDRPAVFSSKPVLSSDICFKKKKVPVLQKDSGVAEHLGANPIPSKIRKGLDLLCSSKNQIQSLLWKRVPSTDLKIPRTSHNQSAGMHEADAQVAPESASKSKHTSVRTGSYPKKRKLELNWQKDQANFLLERAKKTPYFKDLVPGRKPPQESSPGVFSSKSLTNAPYEMYSVKHGKFSNKTCASSGSFRPNHEKTSTSTATANNSSAKKKKCANPLTKKLLKKFNFKTLKEQKCQGLDSLCRQLSAPKKSHQPSGPSQKEDSVNSNHLGRPQQASNK